MWRMRPSWVALLFTVGWRSRARRSALQRCVLRARWAASLGQVFWWMLPLLEIRNALDGRSSKAARKRDRERRDFRRLSGRLHHSIDTSGESQLVPGPYTQQARLLAPAGAGGANLDPRKRPRACTRHQAHQPGRARPDPPDLGRRQARGRGLDTRYLRRNDRVSIPGRRDRRGPGLRPRPACPAARASAATISATSRCATCWKLNAATAARPNATACSRRSSARSSSASSTTKPTPAISHRAGPRRLQPAQADGDADTAEAGAAALWVCAIDAPALKAEAAETPAIETAGPTGTRDLFGET